MPALGKWLNILLFSFCFLFLGVKIVLSADTTRNVKVGVYENKPKIYHEDNGKVSGFFADILDFIAIQENWKIDYVSGTFAEGLDRLEKGTIDIMVDTAYSEERAAIFDFNNETVLGSWGVIYVRKGSDIENFQDLNGKKVGILKSSVYLEGFQGMKAYVNSFGIKVEYFEYMEYLEIFRALTDGKVDAVVVSRIFGMTNIKDYPELKETNIFFSPTELRLALHKGNPDNPYLIDRLDYWIKNIKDGYRNFYTDSLNKYGLLSASPQKEVIPRWVMYAGVVIGAILFFLLIVNLLLRRTREAVARELRKKELMLGNVVDNTSIFLASTDDEGIITLFAGKGTGLEEFLPKNVVGRSAFDVFKDNIPVTSNLKKALAGESAIFKAEIAKRTWKVQITPLMENGKISSIVATAFDYTEEERLDKEKTEFIYLASHHLRTPSTEIKWYLQLLWPRIKKVIKGKDLDIWNGLNSANDSIINLADTLSITSWLEMSSFSPSFDKINLPALLEKVVNLFSDEIKAKNLTISIDCGDISEVYLDMNRVKTVMGSLISNAIVYSKEKDRIKIKAVVNNDNINLSVSDTGIGIPKNEQAMIFKRLFRASNAIKKYATGVGLSLYIAKMIVQNLRGRVWFESEENKSTTFYVELPLGQKLI